MTNESNGRASENEAQTMSPEQQAELMKQAVAATTQQIAEMLVMLAPHLDDDLVFDLATKTAQEQVYRIPQEVLPSLFSPEARHNHPTFWAAVQKTSDKKKNRKDTPVAIVKAAKDLAKVSEAGPALTSMSIFALLMTPAARALLRAYGFHIEFGQSTEEPKKLITM